MLLSKILLGMLLMNTNATLAKNAYDFTFTTLVGHEAMPLKMYRGKTILIVNVASKCGFTGQYAGLEQLFEKYKDQGLVIIGVPSNDFAKQEPGSNQEIANFCRLNYGVSFPMTEKVHVIGKDAHPFFQWAKQTLGFASAPKWNFHKYLINRHGELVDYFYSTTTPNSKRFLQTIEKNLK